MLYVMFNLKFLTILLITINCVSSFYIPGVAPREYEEHEKVEIKAVKITSSKTQLPYEYYSLPFCKPKEILYKAENLGEVLRGDRIVNTPYNVAMNMNVECERLCKSTLNEDSAKTLVKRIKDDYYVHLLADNLPAATAWYVDENKDDVQMEKGFKLGVVVNGETFINNHLSITMRYNKWSEKVDTYRVVGFEVAPRSIDASSYEEKEGDVCVIDFKTAKRQAVTEKTEQVVFSYDVTWVSSEIRWASRWDNYLKMGDVQVHWFSIVNSIVVVFFLAGVLTMILIRTLRRDIAQYNQDSEDMEDALEETGWKLVHGDVFRPPKRIMLLVSFIGAGVQLFGMALITIVAAMLGMLSPASRGALLTASFLLFIFMGVFGGYFAGRLYKSLKGQLWKRAAIQTALLYPSICLTVAFLLNFLIWGKHSSGAVPFTTMIALLAMWFGISLPLVVIGFYFGYRKQAYKNPVRTNQIPRQVPPQPWYMNSFISILLAGILPFGAVFIELFFIFSALWENQFYYLFGFLFIVFVILIIACSQIAIVMVYFQLCAEDYHWWWKSYSVSGGSAIYVFLYSLFYFYTQLEITAFIPTLLYFGYTFIIVFSFWMLTGTIGFWASFFFIQKIYGSVKVD